MRLPNVFKDVLGLLEKAIPNADLRKQIEGQIALAANALKQPIVISVVAIFWIVTYQAKTVYYKINSIVYANTVEFWVDVIGVMVMLAFLYGVSFDKIIDTVKSFIDKFIIEPIKKRKNK